MFAKYAVLSSRRTLLKTILFILLLTLITAMLASSLGLTVSVETALRDCQNSYRTIGVAEYYTGAETVNAEEIHKLADQFAEITFPDNVLRWEPTRMAQGCFTDIDTRISASAVKNKAVLLVKYCEQPKGEATVYTVDNNGVLHEVSNAGEKPQQLLVEKAFFSEQPVETHFMDVKTEDYPFEVGHHYLICGEFFQGNLLNHCLELWQDDPDLAPLDVTDGDGYFLPETSVFYDLAEEYELRTRSFSVYAATHLSDFFPFQQKTVELMDGRMFTEDEETSGARVCIISRAISEVLGLTVGSKTTLSLAVREDVPLFESYRLRDGFDLQEEYTVIGICDYQDAWNNAVFIPVPDGLDMTVNHCTATLGQFLLENEGAGSFAAEAKDLLPSGVQLSVYDQGYARALKPLQNTLRTVRIIAVVCVLVGLGFLLLLGWLLVYRQRQVGSLMLRIGATRKNVNSHYLVSMAIIALPAAVLGAAVSIALSGVVAALVNSALRGAADTELLFSNSSLSLQQSDDLVQRTATVPLLLICAAVFVLALVSCLLFVGKALPKKQRSRQAVFGLQSAKSRSLQGGAVKYASLSVLRGGFRSLLPLLAALCAAVLFCRLTTSVTDCSAQLDALGEGAEIRGYFTDYSGQRCGNVLINLKDVYRLMDSGLVKSMSASDSANYMFYAAVKDGALTDIETPIVPHSEYSAPAAERRMANSPALIYTNSVADLPQFLYSHAPEITWLDLTDESVLDQRYFADYHLLTVYKDGLVPADDPDGIEERELAQKVQGVAGELNALPCVAPTSLLQAHGLALGDDLIVIPLIGQDSVVLLRLHVVGCYDKANGRDDLIVPLSAALGGETLDMRGQTYNEAMGLSKYPRTHISLRSAVFRVSCENLAETKEGFAEAGFSSPYNMDGMRIFVVMEDSEFYLSRHALAQRLWYMERIFPAVYALTLALAAVLAVLQVQARKKELRLMRSLGTTDKGAFWRIYLEQMFLCILGTALGLGICAAFGSLSRSGALLSAAFALFWLVGALIAALRACGGALLQTRRDDN